VALLRPSIAKLTVLPILLTTALRSGPVSALHAFARRITVDEAEHRAAAVEQMAGRVLRLLARDRDLPRWTTRVDGRLLPHRDVLDGEVERLCGEGVADMDGLRLHASFVALMFYEEVEVGSWWESPLGRLCGRVLHDSED
jgi:hypothetical protein